MPQAVTIIAMHLVAVPTYLSAALPSVEAGLRPLLFEKVPLAVPKSGSRVRRIASVLKLISGCDRHSGDTSTDPDNKAGREVLWETQALLGKPILPTGLYDLCVTPAPWLR